MKARTPLFLGSIALATAGLTACASMLGGEPVKVRPVETKSGLTPLQGDPLYESAVTAINARDYGRALDYLQQAKAEKPGNVKVLNALGVVYDKLGRFDLSARYYSQAQAADPNSRIVAANLEYSKVLQGLQGGDQHLAAATPSAPVANSLSAARSAPLPPAAETTVARAPQQAETQSAIAASLHPSLVSAPTIKPVASPIVVVSIPPEVVAPAALAPEGKTTVLPNSPVSIAALAQPSEKRKVVILAAPKARPVDPARIITVRGESVSGPSIQAKLPAVLPIRAVDVGPVPRPAERQVVASLPAPRMTPDISEKVILASSESASTVILAPKQPAALSVHAKQVSALVPSPRPALEIRPVPEKVAAIISQKVPAPFMQHAAVQIKPSVVSAHLLAPVAPVTHVQESRVAARLVPSNPKLPKSAAPTILRETAVPVAPVRVVFATPGHAKVLTVGKPVKMLNASGKPGGIGTISHRLAVLGWSVRQFDWRMQPATTLYYPAKNIVAAKAMLRTLPFPARFIPDNDDSFAMRLVIGHDFLSWKPKNSRLADLWQKGPVIASLQRPLIRGVR